MYSSVPSTPIWNPATQPSLDRARTTTSPPPTSPTSPTRTGRLRGLSYLRTYTQNHILSRDSHSHNSSHTTQARPSLAARSTSYPSPSPSPSSSPTSTSTSTATATRAATSAIPEPPPPTPPQPARQTSPTPRRTTSDVPAARSSNQENLSNTSGWLPTVGGQSGVSRIASEPQSTATASSSAVLSGNNPSAVTSDLTASMARTRSAPSAGPANMNMAQLAAETQSHPQPDATPQTTTANAEARGTTRTTTTTTTTTTTHQLPSIRFSAHQDPRAQRPSLVFSPLSRILPSGTETIKVGRYSERDNMPVQAINVPSGAPVGFKSKVVSRRHCEFWYSAGSWYIKDVKSSSGTFLNHIRLSSPGTESKPFVVKDGDIVQLGIDFKGGEEMIFRCVKIRVELNKGWQTGPSCFNVQSHKRLRELNNLGKPSASGSSQDCSICLGPIAPCQSLFVAPCSHTWHYKCIRIIINGPHWPHFCCPNCRTVADLEAELDDPFASGEWEEVETADAEADADSSAQTPSHHDSSQSLEDSSRQTTDQSSLAVNSSVHLEVDTEHGHSSSSDIEIAEVSDDSGPDPGVTRVIEHMDYMDLNRDASPSGSVDSIPRVSNSTVSPVDIARKPVAMSSSGTAASIGRSSSRPGRETRTPSPHGSGASSGASLSAEAVVTEGPMTPRNDVGPFVLDGSGNGSAGVRTLDASGMAGMATINLAAAADSPLPAS